MSSSDTFLANERERLLAQYAEIASLAGALAHEIRNPLSTVSLNLELLAEDLGEGATPRDRRMLNRIQLVQRECAHLQDILEDFLQFARVGELELTEADLNGVVQEFIEFFAPQAVEHSVELSPHLSPDLPPVRLDRSLLRQVLMNLALNAQQAMPDGGTIELQTFAQEGQVCLRLIDNGNGMDDRTQAKLFQIFFSTKPGGSGLGLPTVKKIIEAHGGTVSVESALGKGTRFTIRLPTA